MGPILSSYVSGKAAAKGGVSAEVLAEKEQTIYELKEMNEVGGFACPRVWGGGARLRVAEPCRQGPAAGQIDLLATIATAVLHGMQPPAPAATADPGDQGAQAGAAGEA
jgi:hypothetical protein